MLGVGGVHPPFNFPASSWVGLASCTGAGSNFAAKMAGRTFHLKAAIRRLLRRTLCCLWLGPRPESTCTQAMSCAPICRNSLLRYCRPDGAEERGRVRPETRLSRLTGRGMLWAGNLASFLPSYPSWIRTGPREASFRGPFRHSFSERRSSKTHQAHGARCSSLCGVIAMAKHAARYELSCLLHLEDQVAPYPCRTSGTPLPSRSLTPLPSPKG